MTAPPHFSDVEYLLDGFDHVETREDFRARLTLGRPLNVKLGIDPTSPDLHLGFMVVLAKLQRFARRRTSSNVDHRRLYGPHRRSQRKKRRCVRRLRAKRSKRTCRPIADKRARCSTSNASTCATTRSGSTVSTLRDLIKLLAQTTVAQMLERNDFHTRYAAGTPISLHEFLYPVAQAYDSIAVEADVELGGSDQLFNLLLGRHYQREYGQPPQICATVPLLVGLDGREEDEQVARQLRRHRPKPPRSSSGS